MSKKDETLVWDRSRAKGSNLLVLICIADHTTDGRDAFPGLEYLAKRARLSERGLRYILHKLEVDGEIVIDLNLDGKMLPIGKREFCPEWLLHVRCVFAWDAYALQDQSEKFSSSQFPTGRPKVVKQAEKFADSLADQSEKFSQTIGKVFPAIRNDPRTLDPRTHTPRLAFKGLRFAVPRFLHEQFADQLGATGRGRFDLLTWYGQLDAQDDGPIVGDLLAWVRHAFAEESQRRFGPRSVGRLSYADWICPHLPPCTHPSRCQQLQDIAAEKARVSA